MVLTVNAQRGQTFPVWAMGSLSCMVLLAMVLNYGNMLTWQFRAQNAADSAARGLLAAQTTQWNQTLTALHAAAIDEYRIRNILRDLDEVVNGEGGCNGGDYHDIHSCDAMYLNLRGQYMDAVQRYTADALLIHRVATPNQATQIANMNAALTQMQKTGVCGTANGLDCGFTYALVGTQARDDNYLEDVYSDCCTFVVGGGTSSNPKPDLTPMEVEVVACANVSTLIPAFFNTQAPTFSAIGRAAATSIMANQEFMYLGSIVNPTTGNVFQQAEFPEGTSGSAVLANSENDGYYRIDYGGNPDNTWNHGNPAISNGKAAFTYSPANAGLLAATGWWSAMPVPTFKGTLTPGTQFQCK
ncbi:MAG TPA: Tad domain-containing protein [Candidatus Baltobacteraceae bacterium]|nr:Tad domain-containing protein [Candidatus Baltobacteraceae bacterium]